MKTHWNGNYNKTPAVVRTVGVQISTGVQSAPHPDIQHKYYIRKVRICQGGFEKYLNFFVSLSMILYKVVKEFDRRQPAERAHGDVVSPI